MAAMAVPLKVSIHSLCNEPFDLDVLDTETVSDLRSMLFERLGFDPYQAALETDFWYHSLGRFHCDAERVQSGDRMQPDDAGGEPWPQRSLCVEHQR